MSFLCFNSFPWQQEAQHCSEKSLQANMKGEGIEAFIFTVFVRFLFLSPGIFSLESQWWNMWNWISNNISKFHKNPTVNETSIIVLLGGFGFLWEKKRLQCEMYFSQLRHLFVIPNGENAQNWVANMVLKCHDDPTVNESEIFIFLRQVWWTAEKRKGFGKRIEKKRNWEAEDAEESVWKLT